MDREQISVAPIGGEGEEEEIHESTTLFVVVDYVFLVPDRFHLVPLLPRRLSSPLHRILVHEAGATINIWRGERGGT
ncbi:hypothetical protein GUJ93_ZPchr0004g38846 [Zizania palustris]|uniref:Uncharacterized protein n=1 Tax=Zizania palustris TaxID=103762 RepID=A0A8J5VPD0_ZIZPA|nr:hypothetical protein GUJ93_ZPchr0004g38846 [Zizania palustris]